ncbi:MAG: PAS domain-containing sensor histidine kinase [Cyclobacteriaceae bacterium]|nr:PAS domain-containing sensor histidine kinase [Cyclobacteriaceae bacterium]
MEPIQSELVTVRSLHQLWQIPEAISHIPIGGRKVTIERFFSYNSIDNKFQSWHYWMDDSVILIVSKGSPSPFDVRRASESLLHILQEAGTQGADLIWDVQELTHPGIKVRRAIIEGNRKLTKHLQKKFLVISPKYKTLIRIYKFLYQKRVEQLYFENSPEEAFHKITSGILPPDNTVYHITDRLSNRKRLIQKSKEELVDMIESFTMNQEKNTNKVLDALGHISWDGKFSKVEIDVDENDPNYELINAFSILQQDVEEIIGEYKDLNQNLEYKVAERIVDYIDKESNLRSILDNSDRVTWLVNNRLELIEFNTAFSNEIKRRYKQTPQINHFVLDYITDENEKEAWKARFESALLGKSGIYLEQDKFDGDDRVWEIKTFPIREIGKIKGVAVFIEDITPLKQSQMKLIEKNRDLQKVNSELDSFVYRVSHDLRAPLTSILGLINLMKLESSKEKVMEYVDLQEKSIRKLDLFIKEIINLSRNSRLGITVNKIDFKELIDEIFEAQYYTSSAEKIERISEFQENMEFYTDRQRLSIILNNLISNGLKYANPHAEKQFVKVKASIENSDCIIEVSDNGIGIAEIYMPKIFEMFFRATQDFHGSGLGLYIVKETVEKLKGKVTVKSKMRVGSTFRIIIPNLKDRFEAAPKLE